MHVTGRQSKPIQNRKLCGVRPNICLLAIALVASVYSPAAWPQADPALPALTADQVVQRLMERNQERAAALQHYLGKRSYRLEYHGFPASAEATMDVEVNFDAPATSASPRQHDGIEDDPESRLSPVLESEEQAGDANNRSHTELGPDNYTFSLAGTEGKNYCA